MKVSDIYCDFCGEKIPNEELVEMVNTSSNREYHAHASCMIPLRSDGKPAVSAIVQKAVDAFRDGVIKDTLDYSKRLSSQLDNMPLTRSAVNAALVAMLSSMNVEANIGWCDGISLKEKK